MELSDALNVSPEPSRTEHNVRGPLLVLSVLGREKHRIQCSPQLQLLGPHVMGVHACFFSRRRIPPRLCSPSECLERKTNSTHTNKVRRRIQPARRYNIVRDDTS